MPYCLYVRKSRADAEAEARGEGETLTRHIECLLALAAKRHLCITQIYKEIVSGETLAARPVAQKLLAEVEQGAWEGVLVMEIERLARGDTIDQGLVAQAFKYSATKIITPVKDYDPNNEFDEEYFEFGLFMSRREYKTINRRLQQGKLASVMEGKYLASVPPLGYDRVKLENEPGYTLKPGNDADTVKLIFDMYTKGVPDEDGGYKRIGVSLIAKRLQEMHLKPSVGEKWSPSSIRDILINPVYIGKIRWNWRKSTKKVTNGKLTKERPRTPNTCIVVNGKHPAIISEETFELAQEYMSNNKARPLVNNKSVKSPLCGLVVCAKCGHNMIRKPFKNGSPDSLMCNYTFCNNISSPLSMVEERVLERLREWLTNYRAKWNNDPDIKQMQSGIELKEKAIVKLSDERQKLQNQLDNIYDLFEQGVYSGEVFTARSAKISEKLKQNQSDEEAITKELVTERRRLNARTIIIPKVETVLSVYSELPTAKAKNEMLKGVIEKIYYLKEPATKTGRWSARPDEFTITVYPRIDDPEDPD